MRPSKSPLLAFLLGALLVGAVTYADGADDPVTRIPYRGYLTDGEAPVTGVRSMTFRLFDVSTGGPELWSATRDVDVVSGSFAVLLGEPDPLPRAVHTANAVYLEVAVDGQVLGARQQLFAAHQGVTAQDATHADSADEAFLTTDLLVRQAGGYARIRFEETANDEAEIAHVENAGAGQLWLASSNDWDTAADNDLIIFGDRAGGIRRHEFRANGDARIYRDLYVDRDVQVTGVVNSGCPAGMNDAGSFCIEAEHSVGNQTSWFDTNESCVSRGRRLCSNAEVSAAVRLGHTRSYSFGGEGNYWTWTGDAGGDNAGGNTAIPCHVNLNHDEPNYTLGEWNCQINGFETNNTAIRGVCCY